MKKLKELVLPIMKYFYCWLFGGECLLKTGFTEVIGAYGFYILLWEFEIQQFLRFWNK